MSYIALPNPLWSAQLQILGGPLRLLWRSLVYGAVLLSGLAIFRLPLGDMPLNEYIGGALKILAGLQCGVVLVGGSSAIGRALLRDNSGRMIESHRTAPLSALTVVLGYVVGPCLQILVYFLVGVLVGLGLAMASGFSTRHWLLGNSCLLVAAWSIWPVAVFFSLSATKRAPFAGFLMIASFSSRGWMELLPSLGLASGIISVLWCFGEMLGKCPSYHGLAVVLMIDVLLGLYWLVVSTRRFRWPHLSPLSPRAAWCLGGIWVLIAGLGLAQERYYLDWGGHLRDLHAVAALIATMAVAVLPFMMAVQAQRWSMIRQGPGGRKEGLRPWAWVAAGAALVVVQARVSSAAAGTLWEQQRAMLLLLPLLGLFMGCAVVRLMHFTFARHAPAVVLLAVLWLAPPILNLFYLGRLGGEFDPAQMNWVGTSSPVGAMIALWYGSASPGPEQKTQAPAASGEAARATAGRSPLSVGAAVMSALTVLAMLLGNRAVARFRRQRKQLMLPYSQLMLPYSQLMLP